ncbi:unnamed protein product [Hydatigera taeniaeformis]|uniref:Uncharacterized protein n=1 Tax=Hydatigena taeniaeformis TaxID=6205 RepID=A0A0R3WV13_HYDTA|nr:unnamed protein product [Hydatigera taeniaeformis]
MSLRRPPLVIASVIPLSRDPLMQSGIPKCPNGTSSGGVGKQRSAPETPGALLNSLFRHTNNAARSGSLAQEEILANASLPVAKPLSHIKPVDSVVGDLVCFLLRVSYVTVFQSTSP